MVFPLPRSAQAHCIRLGASRRPRGSSRRRRGRRCVQTRSESAGHRRGKPPRPVCPGPGRATLHQGLRPSLSSAVARGGRRVPGPTTSLRTGPCASGGRASWRGGPAALLRSEPPPPALGGAARTRVCRAAPESGPRGHRTPDPQELKGAGPTGPAPQSSSCPAGWSGTLQRRSNTWV